MVEKSYHFSCSEKKGLLSEIKLESHFVPFKTLATISFCIKNTRMHRQITRQCMAFIKNSNFIVSDNRQKDLLEKLLVVFDCSQLSSRKLFCHLGMQILGECFRKLSLPSPFAPAISKWACKFYVTIR